MALEHVSPGDPHAVSHNEERDQINFLAGEVGKPNRTSSRAFFSMHKALVSGDATIIAMGDSKTEGTGLETSTERWLYKLQESLRAQYGETDKGYGYIPAKYGTFYDFTDKPTTAGTVTGITQGRGLGTRSLKMSAGASVTFPTLPYTANAPLVVHWTRKSGGGEFEVVVGGVVRATIATDGGVASRQTEVALPAGDHAVQLRTKGTATVNIEGIFHRTAVEGIRVVDGSISGGMFQNFGQDLLGDGHWSAAAYYGIDGVIMAFGANDMSGLTPEQMRVDARAAVDKALAAAPDAGIVILMGTERTQTPETGTVRTYEAAMRSEFAEDANVTLLYESDLWMPKAGVDYTWGGPSGWLVDTVHTSAHAHTEIARYIGEGLKSAQVTPEQIGAATTSDVSDLSTEIDQKLATKAAKTHASTHAKGGSDPITPESIGAVNGAAIQPPGAWADMDANDLTTAGRYLLYGGASQNTPTGVTSAPCIVDVLANNAAGSLLVQVLRSPAGGSEEWVRSFSGGAWSPWKRSVMDDDPRLLDTGWRRLFSWTNGVQNAAGQYASIRTDNYILSGNGYIDMRRTGNFVHLRTASAASDSFSTTSNTPALDFCNGVFPSGFRPNFGGSGQVINLANDASGSLVELRVNGGSLAIGFPTRGGPTAMIRLSGSWFTEMDFPVQPYPGVPA